jgi:hypothetical protein
MRTKQRAISRHLRLLSAYRSGVAAGHARERVPGVGRPARDISLPPSGGGATVEPSGAPLVWMVHQGRVHRFGGEPDTCYPSSSGMAAQE